MEGAAWGVRTVVTQKAVNLKIQEKGNIKNITQPNANLLSR